MIGVRHGQSACMRRIVVSRWQLITPSSRCVCGVLSAAGFLSAFGPAGQMVGGSDCGDLVNASAPAAASAAAAAQAMTGTPVPGPGAPVVASAMSSRAACILLDIDLGDVSGIELGHRLKAANVSAPIIYMTGNDSPAVRKAAHKSGCLAFLTKPFSAASWRTIFDSPQSDDVTPPATAICARRRSTRPGRDPGVVGRVARHQRAVSQPAVRSIFPARLRPATCVQNLARFSAVNENPDGIALITSIIDLHRITHQGQFVEGKCHWASSVL